MIPRIADNGIQCVLSICQACTNTDREDEHTSDCTIDGDPRTMPTRIVPFLPAAASKIWWLLEFQHIARKQSSLYLRLILEVDL